MPGIIEYPRVVQEAMKEYGEVFVNEPERKHMAEYLTGLLIAERKSVRGINSEFVVTSDQSCLNRWITEVEWDVKKLNERRLELLKKDPETQWNGHGVIAVDDVLVDHEGKLIEDVGYFWDHADKRHLIAHDYLVAGYVCSSGKSYPLEFKRFVKKEVCERIGNVFQNHTKLFCELVDWVCQKEILGDFAFDCYFTNAEILNHIQSMGCSYVGNLKFNRKILFKGVLQKASELAMNIAPKDKKMVEINGQRQWYFTKTVRIPEVEHRVRVVILYKHKEDKEAVKIFVTNRTIWEVTRILRVYWKRWKGTETFFRDGKQHLGMGDCQLRCSAGQTRHMYLVFLAHSLMIRQMRQGRSQDWALSRLTTIGEACRAVLRETLSKTIQWAIDRSHDGWSYDSIRTHLMLA